MSQADPPYFTASALKFSVLSLCTLGYYPFYWFYRNWRLYKTRTGRRIMPTWRATFAPLWAFSLLRDIEGKAQEKAIARGKIPPAGEAALFAILLLLAVAPAPYNLAANLSFLPLLPANGAAQRINRAEITAYKENGRFGVLNILTVFFGGLILAATLWGAFYTGPSLAQKILENSPYGEMFSLSSQITGK